MYKGDGETNPQVSAVVINLDGRELLADALRSLEEQNYPNLDLVVVDNGSKDGSQRMVKEQFPEVHLIENSRNYGFGGANNMGIEYSLRKKSDFVFLFNNDAVADRSCVDELVLSSIRNDAGITGPKIFYYDKSNVIWSAGGRVNFWTGNLSHRGIRYRDEGKYDEETDVDYLTACAVLIKREVIERIGMFDEIYHPIYCEDTDLCQRAKNAGFRLQYEPKAEVRHKISAYSGGGISPFKVKLRMRNQLIFFRRYARWYHWTTMPLFIMARTIGYAVRWILSGRWGLAEALCDGVRGLLLFEKGTSRTDAKDPSGERREPLE